MVSEWMENSGGAGDDPNGRRVSIEAINDSHSFPSSSCSLTFQADMHFAAILGVVCSRLYAFSKSDLHINIRLSGLFFLML